MTKTDIEGKPERQDEKIVGALAREARRRKRILAVYLSLLVIPVATGVWYLNHGQMDRQLVRQDVSRQLGPVKLQLEAVEPALKTVQEAGDQLASHQSALIELRAEQEQVVSQLEPISQRVESFASDLEGVRQVRGEISEIRQRMVGYTERLTQLEGEQESLRVNQNRLSRQHDSLARDIGALQRGIGDSPEAAPPGQLQELMRELGNLKRKIESTESDVTGLRQRVERIQRPPR